MYRMSKKSLAGIIMVSPLFFLLLVLEMTLDKAGDWSYSVRRFRIKMTDFVDEKFPLANNRKTKT